MLETTHEPHTDAPTHPAQPTNHPATPTLRTRLNQAKLTPAQWADFIVAMKAIKATGATFAAFGDLVNCHMHINHHHQAHMFPYFLPWHRCFILTMEARLRQVNPHVTLPYWDWTVDTTVPKPLIKAADWGVTRHPNVQINGATAKEAVQAAMAATTYQAFHDAINPVHNQIHNEVGGDMAGMETSPKDVLFWLHHANIDRIWAEWQKAHPNQMVTSDEAKAALLPTTLAGHPMFAFTATQMMDTKAHGYIYG